MVPQPPWHLPFVYSLFSTIDWPLAPHSYPIHNEICQMNIEQFKQLQLLPTNALVLLALRYDFVSISTNSVVWAECRGTLCQTHNPLEGLLIPSGLEAPQDPPQRSWTMELELRSLLSCPHNSGPDEQPELSRKTAKVHKGILWVHVCVRDGMVLLTSAARINTQMPLRSSPITNSETIAFSVNILWKLCICQKLLCNFYSFILTTSTE